MKGVSPNGKLHTGQVLQRNKKEENKMLTTIISHNIEHNKKRDICTKLVQRLCCDKNNLSLQDNTPDQPSDQNLV